VVAAARVVDEGAARLQRHPNETRSRAQETLWRREMHRERYYHHLFRYQWAA
jgi:hypothetical protein